MVVTLIVLFLSAPPPAQCAARPPKVGVWTPTAAQVSQALKATAGGTCKGCVPLAELDRGVRACGEKAKSTAVTTDVATEKCGGGGYCDGQRGKACSCNVDVAAAEWKGRRFIRVIANPGIDDYTVDLFELKGARVGPLVREWAPYMSTLCNDGEGIGPGPKALEKDWKAFPKELQLYFCNYDG